MKWLLDWFTPKPVSLPAPAPLWEVNNPGTTAPMPDFAIHSNGSVTMDCPSGAYTTRLTFNLEAFREFVRSSQVALEVLENMLEKK